MKKVMFCFGLMALTVSGSCQIRKDNYNKNCEVSDFWEVKPSLYNNEYSKDNRVYRWKNYWYMRESNTKELIPDTLIIQFRFNVNALHIAEDYAEFIKDVDYTFKSVIQYKYGDTDYSYYVKNPKITNPIVLIEKKIPLGKITRNLINVEFEDIFVNIPMKQHLKHLNIYICDTIPLNGDYYALNQIIITSYFINDKGEIKNIYEFIFPINGSYEDMPEYGVVRYH